MKDYPFQVGDIVVPKDGSNYSSEIISISFEDGEVIHRVIGEDNQYGMSIFAMPFRYRLHPENNRLRKLKAFK